MSLCATKVAVWVYSYAVFILVNIGSVIIVAKNDAIAKAITADPYLKERKAPSEADQQLYLKEVSFLCPLCGASLRHRRQKKTNKDIPPS